MNVVVRKEVESRLETIYHMSINGSLDELVDYQRIHILSNLLYIYDTSWQVSSFPILIGGGPNSLNTEEDEEGNSKNAPAISKRDTAQLRSWLNRVGVAYLVPPGTNLADSKKFLHLITTLMDKTEQRHGAKLKPIIRQIVGKQNRLNVRQLSTTTLSRHSMVSEHNDSRNSHTTENHPHLSVPEETVGKDTTISPKENNPFKGRTLARSAARSPGEPSSSGPVNLIPTGPQLDRTPLKPGLPGYPVVPDIVRPDVEAVLDNDDEDELFKRPETNSKAKNIVPTGPTIPRTPHVNSIMADDCQVTTDDDNTEEENEEERLKNFIPTGNALPRTPAHTNRNSHVPEVVVQQATPSHVMNIDEVLILPKEQDPKGTPASYEQPKRNFIPSGSHLPRTPFVHRENDEPEEAPDSPPEANVSGPEIEEIRHEQLELENVNKTVEQQNDHNCQINREQQSLENHQAEDVEQPNQEEELISKSEEESELKEKASIEEELEEKTDGNKDLKSTQDKRKSAEAITKDDAKNVRKSPEAITKDDSKNVSRRGRQKKSNSINTGEAQQQTVIKSKTVIGGKKISPKVDNRKTSRKRKSLEAAHKAESTENDAIKRVVERAKANTSVEKTESVAESEEKNVPEDEQNNINEIHKESPEEVLDQEDKSATLRRSARNHGKTFSLNESNLAEMSKEKKVIEDLVLKATQDKEKGQTKKRLVLRRRNTTKMATEEEQQQQIKMTNETSKKRRTTKEVPIVLPKIEKNSSRRRKNLKENNDINDTIKETMAPLKTHLDTARVKDNVYSTPYVTAEKDKSKKSRATTRNAKGKPNTVGGKFAVAKDEIFNADETNRDVIEQQQAVLKDVDDDIYQTPTRRRKVK